MQRVQVAFDYPVLFTRGMFRPPNRTLRDALTRAREDGSSARRQRVAVIIDSGVGAAWPQLTENIEAYFEAHAELLELASAPRLFMGGEAAKNHPALIRQLQAGFFADKLDRHCTVLIIGGGAILDAVGYAAALCHRGLRVVRAPTTVLAQNDAGIGVKNGVNDFGVKNALGCFAPPFAVVNDLDFISTLEPRDQVAGIAEAIKVGLIRDADFFDWLESNAEALAAGERDAMAYMIRRCAELHLAHIRDSGDPFEVGSARPLDFGHWAAHKLELLSKHELRHGEAVAIGISIDSRYSHMIGRLSAEALARIDRLLTALRLPRWHHTLELRDASHLRRVMVGLEEFREHLGGELTITLLEGVGVGYETHEIDSRVMSTAIDQLRDQASES